MVDLLNKKSGRMVPQEGRCQRSGKEKNSRRFLVGAVSNPPLSKILARFFHIEAQLLHGRPIVDGEKNGVIVTSVFVVVPLPRRHGENVPFVILQPLVFDDHGALTFKRKVEGSAVMPVR